MFNLSTSFIFLAVFFLSVNLFSQDTFQKSDSTNLKNEPASLPNLHPYLKNLSEDEKLKALEYLRHLGGKLDDEILLIFKKLDPPAQEKFLLHLENLQPEKPQPTTVEWDFQEIDFGKIEEGRILLDTLNVKNTGKFPYQISHFQSSCDCTVAEKPEFPVMPGETGRVQIEFNSWGKIGVFKIGIVIHDNSDPNLRSIIYIKGIVTPRRP